MLLGRTPNDGVAALDAVCAQGLVAQLLFAMIQEDGGCREPVLSVEDREGSDPVIANRVEARRLSVAPMEGLLCLCAELLEYEPDLVGFRAI